MYRAGLFVRRLWTIGIVSCAAAALMCASRHGLPRLVAGEAPKPATTTGKMRIHVVDAAGQPLPGAQVHVSVWTNEEFTNNRDYTCDSQGQAEIDLPKTLDILRLWAANAGHSGMFANMETNAQDNELVIPDDFTFRLPKGTIMGGVVKDEDGQPIEGARVALRYVSGGAIEDEKASPTLEAFQMTDAEGRWRFDIVPPGDDVQVRVNVSHPDYVSDHAGELQKKQSVTSQALRAETAAIVMQRGTSVTGKVTDPEGKPVAGAVVVWGDRPYWQSGSQEVHTSEDGVYRFAPLPAGPMRVTVVAEGWMPDSRKIEIAPHIQPADFQLKPGKKLSIRVVDGSGTPVPDVGVGIERWRGGESLYNDKHPNVVDTKVPRSADKNGRFEWTWAPDDAVTYSFSKPGFAYTTASVAADDSEHVQTIHAVLHVAGSVRDAATGQPIDEFLAVPVIYFTPDFPFLPRQIAQRQNAGKLSMEFARTDIEHGIQVEAAGYVTFRSPGRYRIGDANPTLDIRLQSTERYVGQILDQDGQAVESARVYVATGFQHLDLNNLEDRGGESNYRVNADHEGAFEIAGQMERYALVVIAPEGYAEVEREARQKPGEIRVQPWAKVTGQLVQAGQPVPNCEVKVEPIRHQSGDDPRIDTKFRGVTGDDGSFAFERVPPIACRVRGFLHFSVDSPLSSSQSVPLCLAPGEEASVALGGNGIEVTGQLVAENQPDGFDYHFSISYFVAKRPGIEPPASLAGKGFDWRNGWSDSWRSSQEGQAYLDTLHNWFVKPAPDGHFRISGVEPGDYEFAVNLYGTTEGCLVHPLATRLIRVSVSPGESTLDLGKVSIPSLSLPKVGDPAGDFEFEGLDGSKTSLAAWRGKYVLLDFWATWCGPCVAKLDEVEHIRKQFHVDNGLVVVGVNLDADSQRAREFLKAKPLPWEHALLGDWSSTDVPRRFAIASVPAYVLIDPDGRIMAHESSLDEIASKLKSLTARQPD